MASGKFDPWQHHLETETRSELADRRSLAELEVPGWTVLAHPDPARVGDRVVLPDLAAGRSVGLSRLEPDFEDPASGRRAPLADPRMSRTPLHLEPGDDGAVRIVRGAVRTRILVGGVPLETEVGLDRSALSDGVPVLLGERIALLLHLVGPPTQRGPDWGLVGESAAISQLRQEIQGVTDLPFAVLLRGESGTGKELVARALHDAGPRRGKPYQSVNVGAIPPSLAVSELFGAAKGAYTGALQARSGYFQRADGGTLFLDEIGEAPPEVQVLLLRALESNEIQPVGAASTQKVDVRLVCATDADLEAAVASGDFRSPLLHRLAGYEIALPPLRRRREDLGRLLFHFLRQELRLVGEERRLDDPGPHGRPWMSAEWVCRLAAYDWPGNVRQLKNTARQLVVASRGRPEVVIAAGVERMLSRPSSLGSAVETAGSPGPPTTGVVAEAERRPSYRKPDDVGDEELLAALEVEGWNLQQTAASLGVSRTTLYALIDRCPAVRKASDLDRSEIEGALDTADGAVGAAARTLRVSKQGLRIRMHELGLSRS